MKNLILAISLSVAAASVLAERYQESRFRANLVRADVRVIELQGELVRTTDALSMAKKRLGFLDRYKASVQVTAYTASQGARFANGGSTATVYAVRGHSLPNDKMVFVALSPPARQRLNAKFGDLIALVRRRGDAKFLARFVDVTDPQETRPVVDVFFQKDDQARLWGRKKSEYYAVNISARNSPFRE
ncbi:MAG: hypothetical protein ABSH01_26435 [Terriglobia bacterium]